MSEKVKVKRSEIAVNEFTEQSASFFREQLLERARRDPNAPIMIYIDSYGGSVDALSTMIETMDEVTNPLITVCIGKAMSCGAILLSHGDLRFCGRHSRVLIHEVSGGTSGNVHDVQTDAAEMKRLNEYFMNLLATNCRISGGYKALRKQIKTKDGKDLYMTAQEAIKFGIVDEIGMPTVESMTLYSVIPVAAKKRKMPTPTKAAAVNPKVGKKK